MLKYSPIVLLFEISTEKNVWLIHGRKLWLIKSTICIFHHHVYFCHIYKVSMLLIFWYIYNNNNRYYVYFIYIHRFCICTHFCCEIVIYIGNNLVVIIVLYLNYCFSFSFLSTILIVMNLSKYIYLDREIRPCKNKTYAIVKKDSLKRRYK